eukprot:SAG31_NODE_2317_length_5947_cov_2.753591_7_plen_110_part_00
MPCSVGLIILSVGNAVLLGFLPSMMLASTLCKTKIAMAMALLQDADVDPHQKQSWDRNIAEPAIALHHTMELLSTGWSSGLVGLSLASWFMAFSFFCKVINWEYYTAAL